MKLFFCAAFLAIANISSAQDVMKTIGNETCGCISDLKKTGVEATDMQLGLCIIKAYNAHKAELPKEKQVAISDSEGFEVVATEIGLAMADACPDLVMSFADGDDLAATAKPVHSVSGTVTEIKSEQFTTISVKDANGRQHAMLLLNYFASATLFTEGKIRKGDKVTVTYDEVELYDPKMKEFRYYKVIAGLTK
jgi:hypothetical protein